MIVIVLPDLPAEDRLLAHARQGDQEAIMHIYDSYFSPIYNFIRLRVDDAQAAEDLTSEVFLKLVSALRNHTAPRHSLRGWLFRVARNVLHDYYGRARQITTEALEEWTPAAPEDDLEIQFIRTLDVERTRHALRKLAPEQQEVLILRFGQTLSLQETADIMGKNVGAIKSLQFRAINALRQIFGELHRETENG
ncbi:MAG TPA: sigma-70 family RNA polymerase sigma factor [Phototrophicaceae bacterium]|nr:sigma-70 family RNA polymerase sigma factor [Phototrophicaceae bacterium]